MISFSKTFIAICFLLAVSSLASAQNIDFQPLNGPSGVQSIGSIASDNAGRLFMSMNNKIYHSGNYGDAWTECMNGIPANNSYSQNFLLSPSGAFYVHLEYSSSSLYRYQPASDTWTQVMLPFDQYDVDGIDFDAQGRLWVSTNESHSDIHYSTDGGATFQKIPLTGPVDGWFDALATFNDDHNLIAVSYGASQKLFHFKSNGELQQIPNVDLVRYMGYNPNTGTAYYASYDYFGRSTDGGLTWQGITLVAGQTYQYITNMSFETGGKIWVHASSGTYWSDDDGITWSKDTVLSAVGGNFSLINGSDWFVINSCGYPNFGRSSDGGTTWTDLSSQFFSPSVSRIGVDATGSIYAKTCHRNAYEKSSDNGLTWTDFGFTDSAFLYVQNLAIRPDGAMMTINSNRKCYRSFNNGNSWEQMTNLNFLAPDPNYSYFYTDPYGAFYFFDLAGDAQKSVDSGNSWQQFNFWADIVQEEPAFHPNGDIYMSAPGSGKVYVASGDSTKYLELNNEPYIEVYNVHCTNRGMTFLVAVPSSGPSGLYRILPDGNYNLEAVSSFNNMGVSEIASNVEGDVFIASGTTLYKSEDDGANWSTVGTLPQEGYLTTLSVAPDQYLYAGFSGDVIYRSTKPTAESNFVLGNVWLDNNGDCLFDAGETYQTSVGITATGNGDYASFSGYNGNFTLSAPTGNYTLNVKPPNALFEPCFTDVPVALSGPNDTAIVNLPLKVVAQCPYLSIHLSTPILRRCFGITYTVQYKNEGTATAFGAFANVSLDSFFIFQNATLPVSSQAGFTYTFQLGDLAPGQSGQFQIVVKVSCDASLGQTHCIAAQIQPSDVCLPTLPLLAFYRECRENIGSFDPNDKYAYVDGKETPGYVLPNKDIEYLIRFQNTGTDTAFRVIVEDRFSSLLDLSSVIPEVSSHPYTMEVRDHRVLRFVFDNILLPDSNINEAASHGFIKFRVSQVPNVALGSVIQNEADIFFDFNAPVRTNKSSLIVGTVHTAPTPGNPYRVTAYPNPFGASVNFEIFGPAQSGNLTLRLFDALGRQVRREEFSNEKFSLPRNELKNGLYYFLIESNGKMIGTGKISAQ